MKTDQLHSVKDVLHMCRLTRKQLYVYEEKGLVNPVRNTDNKYRFYTDEQVFNIELIRECRELGFSFDSIRNMLEDMNPATLNESILQAMGDARKKLDASILQYEKNMARYTGLLEATLALSGPEAEVKEEHIPAENTVVYECTGNFYDDVMTFYSCYTNLDRLISEGQFTKISAKRERFTQVFDQNLAINKQNQLIQLSYVVKEDASDNPHFRKTDEYDALTFIHIGSYTEPLVHSYQKIVDYAARKGLSVGCSSIEEHVIEPAISYKNKDMWVTKIIVPIKN